MKRRLLYALLLAALCLVALWLGYADFGAGRVGLYAYQWLLSR